jgi:hypothetical protein
MRGNMQIQGNNRRLRERGETDEKI